MILDLEIGTPLPTISERLHYLEKAVTFPHMAVDTESDPNTGLFLGISTAYLQDAMYWPVGHLEAEANIEESLLESLLEVIRDNPLRVFQNAGFDLKKFEEDLNCPLQGAFADTLIMVHMINEELPNKGLNYIHKQYTGGVGKIRHPIMQQIIDTMGWRYVPVLLMNEYATQDAIATSEVFEVVRPLFEKEYGRMFS